ncbi:hypothetical protein Pcinc_016934 [Petrolisthes cinctipes]|uniref:Uncharacterized protein n=1 Tax=Petrolisthes cinctipes TaxID=88211 RepID=A0AAE1KQD3_PETCI|nr:hypothetical protein Pcinc_016934 [Petrolisthes cinctipes]
MPSQSKKPHYSERREGFSDRNNSAAGDRQIVDPTQRGDLEVKRGYETTLAKVVVLGYLRSEDKPTEIGQDALTGRHSQIIAKYKTRLGREVTVSRRLNL